MNNVKLIFFSSKIPTRKCKEINFEICIMQPYEFSQNIGVLLKEGVDKKYNDLG